MIPFYPSLKWQNLSKPILSAKVSAATVWSPTLRWPVVPARCNSSGRVKVQWSGRPHATGWPPSGTPAYAIVDPCSTKTRKVLGNPSPTPEIRRGKSAAGNFEGGGDGFPNTSRILVKYGHSLIINLSTGSGSGNPSLWAGKD